MVPIGRGRIVVLDLLHRKLMEAALNSNMIPESCSWALILHKSRYLDWLHPFYHSVSCYCLYSVAVVHSSWQYMDTCTNDLNAYFVRDHSTAHSWHIWYRRSMVWKQQSVTDGTGSWQIKTCCHLHWWVVTALEHQWSFSWSVGLSITSCIKKPSTFNLKTSCVFTALTLLVGSFDP